MMWNFFLLPFSLYLFMNALFFWIFSVGMIVCALAVVFNRNAVASALCFTFAIIFMSGLFVMLSAFFLAAVQILVTAGAVMVLFLFIIMLLDLTAMEHAPRQKIWMGCTLVLALGFLLIVAKVLQSTPSELNTANTERARGETIGAASIARMQRDSNNPDLQLTQSDWDEHDDTHRIGRLLFRTDTSNGKTSYVAPFEATSL